MNLQIQTENGWEPVGGIRDLRYSAQGYPILRHWGIPRGKTMLIRDGAVEKVVMHPYDLAQMVAETGKIRRALDLLLQALQDEIRHAPTPKFEEALLAFDRGQILRNARIIQTLQDIRGAEG